MPPPRPSGFSRRWIIGGATVLAVLAVAITLVFTLGGHRTVTGQAIPATDARTIAQTFVTVESQRYNADTTTSTPPPSAAAYAGVSCQKDLAQMRGDGASPPPLTPAHTLYSFTITSPIADRSGQLFRVSRTTLDTRDVGTQWFSLQREGGNWKVCGLFPDTQPQQPDSGGTGSTGGGDAGLGSGAPGGGDTQGGTGSTQPASELSSFLTTFSQAVSNGEVGTAAEAICPDDPQANAPIENWTSAHAQVSAHVNTTGAAGGSAALQVTVPGQPPATYTAVIAQNNGALCIEVLTQ